MFLFFLYIQLPSGSILLIQWLLQMLWIINANVKNTTEIHNTENRDETVFHNPQFVKENSKLNVLSSTRISKNIITTLTFSIKFTRTKLSSPICGSLYYPISNEYWISLLINGLVSPEPGKVEIEKKLTCKSNSIKIAFHLRTGVKVWLGGILSTWQSSD